MKLIGKNSVSKYFQLLFFSPFLSLLLFILFMKSLDFGSFIINIKQEAIFYQNTFF